jgi:tripartite-type tricarboxylate transporter receptor subunit TctC
VVDNRGGGGGAIAGEITARAVPDGYTLISYGSSLWLAPFLREKVSYDPIKDFAPVTLAVSSPAVLVLNPTVAATTVKDLIALAKSRPGTLNYGSGGDGSVPHLALELFKAMAGVNIVRIPYKSAGPAVSDLIGGQLQIMIVAAGSVIPHVKSGKLKALGVASAKPSSLAPGLPTISDAGLPGYEYVSMWGILAPARTPVTIIKRINQETVAFLKKPDTRQRLQDAGIEAIGSTPETFAEALKKEMKVLGKLIKDLKIRSE